MSREGSELRAAYLDEVRSLVLEEIDRIVPSGGPLGPVLYDLVRDYPLRAAKTFRPALAVAACRALGGSVEAVLPSAAALELYHNAFLIHDDVEDGSTLRRDGPTLHQTYGVPVAINVGDAMLALTLRPLLDNTRTVGLGPALRILEVVVEMSRESAEGQAIELDWIRRGTWDLDEDDYLAMVHKKTTWYSFLAPLEIGAIVGGASDAVRQGLRAFATALGAAFQIRDDVLNVDGVEEVMGKEHAGDLWEGKRTLLLLHALSRATPEERAAAVRVLELPRPEAVGLLPGTPTKRPEDVRFLLGIVRRYDGVGRASAVANDLALRASSALDALGDGLPPSVHRSFLQALVGFVVERSR